MVAVAKKSDIGWQCTFSNDKHVQDLGWQRNHQNNQSQACPSPYISNCFVCFRDLDSKQSSGNKADRNRIATFEMWCWRRMLRIPWTMRRTNASILEEIGLSKRLLHTINIQMLSYFGHIARRKGNNLEKVIMQGMIEGKQKERTTSVSMDWPNKISYRTPSPWLLCSCWRSSSMASYVRGHELSTMTGTNQSTIRIRKLNFAKYYKSTQERGDFHSEQ